MMTVSVRVLSCNLLILCLDLNDTAFKPNSTNILVSNLWCNGSHGISVGSLGQVYSLLGISFALIDM